MRSPGKIMKIKGKVLGNLLPANCVHLTCVDHDKYVFDFAGVEHEGFCYRQNIDEGVK